MTDLYDSSLVCHRVISLRSLPSSGVHFKICQAIPASHASKVNFQESFELPDFSRSLSLSFLLYILHLRRLMTIFMVLSQTLDSFLT